MNTNQIYTIFEQFDYETKLQIYASLAKNLYDNWEILEIDENVPENFFDSQVTAINTLIDINEKKKALLKEKAAKLEEIDLNN